MAAPVGAHGTRMLQCKAQLVRVCMIRPKCAEYVLLWLGQVCGQHGLTQGLDQGGALGPADMVALAAAYPLLFIQVTHLKCHQATLRNTHGKALPLTKV